MTFWGDLYAQAAAQGITAFVASGDSGAALCSSPASARGFMASVNGLCSAPYAVCVGGTVLYANSGKATLPFGSDPTAREVEYAWPYTGGGSDYFLAESDAQKRYGYGGAHPPQQRSRRQT